MTHRAMTNKTAPVGSPTQKRRTTRRAPDTITRCAQRCPQRKRLRTWADTVLRSGSRTVASGRDHTVTGNLVRRQLPAKWKETRTEERAQRMWDSEVDTECDRSAFSFAFVAATRDLCSRDPFAFLAAWYLCFPIASSSAAPENRRHGTRIADGGGTRCDDRAAVGAL